MKNFLTLLSIFIFAGQAFAGSSLDVLPLFNSKSNAPNRVWVGIFQLVWNDLMDEIVKGPVKFIGENSILADELNNQQFKAEMLSDNSYYKTFGETSPELKIKIEKDIKEKFNEKSGIIDSMDWSKGVGKYTLYAMLKKDFKFITAFDKLKSAKFAKSKKKVDYFGINGKSDKVLDETVKVLFFNSDKDFAVVINTVSNDLVYLYRTADNKTFDKLYSDMLDKGKKYSGSNTFMEKDELKVPNINIYSMKEFSKLCNKTIQGTDIEISQALETVEFKMNNKGVQLKSEAAIATKMSLMPVIKSNPRKFYFDNTFVIFLKEFEQDFPYFAMRVNDVNLINMTGK